jgi:quinol monooxygenase YgiN
MQIVNVYVHVKKEYIQDFITVTVEHAFNGNQEPGITRFDLIQEQSNPQKFMLVEVYKDVNAPAAHIETDHYKKWRDTVEPMMAGRRSQIKFAAVFTKDTNYKI